ncbi:MAG: iron-containing redox enzyme family protein [Candidatus Aenigmarchaeota archaeon]|nr:iron-containing redox enzyme family protein [Candidatus Aenigmarchaeota archaeon]
MTFKQDILGTIKKHGAINNEFLTQFASGKSSKEEVKRFAVEFYHFSRHFPLVLCSLLVNTADEAEAAELTKILTSELGDGIPEKRHELLYRDFLRSVRIEPMKIIKRPMLKTTKAWIDTQIQLYSGDEHFAGLGASFGLENMAIPMWDQLIAGLKIYKQRWFPDMDMTYFTFHRELEEKHEDAMDTVVNSLKPEAEESFRRGVMEVLDAETAFWVGILDKYQI